MYFEGPWRILKRNSLEQGVTTKPGEILLHRSKAIILNCPVCNAMQFTAAKNIGSREKPTLSKPVHCGAGHCRRCGVWFSVTNGKTVLHEEGDPREAPAMLLSTKLRRAGVVKPPELKVKD
jgi:hypothetical protein